MGRKISRREAIPFRSVNRRGTPGYLDNVQRHHILPRQLLSRRCFGTFFDRVGCTSLGFDDFRANGLLLPSTEGRAIAMGLPLHRGPHRHYNEIVIERVGSIETAWASKHPSDDGRAAVDAIFRLQLLQLALRRRLLEERRRIILNRKNPVGTGFDFTELDTMAEELWRSTAKSTA